MRQWAAIAKKLVRSGRKPLPPPPWWNIDTAYFGSVEPLNHRAGEPLCGMENLLNPHLPHFCFILTLGGKGSLRREGEQPRELHAGQAFFATIPSRHEYFLPVGSEEWIFARLVVARPSLYEKAIHLAERKDPVIRLPPDGPLLDQAVRLVQGAIKKDFAQRLDVEECLVSFISACEKAFAQSTC